MVTNRPWRPSEHVHKWREPLQGGEGHKSITMKSNFHLFSLTFKGDKLIGSCKNSTKSPFPELPPPTIFKRETTSPSQALSHAHVKSKQKPPRPPLTRSPKPQSYTNLVPLIHLVPLSWSTQSFWFPPPLRLSARAPGSSLLLFWAPCPGSPVPLFPPPTLHHGGH